MQERIFEQFESVSHTVFLEISPLHMEIQYKFSDTNSEKKKRKLLICTLKTMVYWGLNVLHSV